MIVLGSGDVFGGYQNRADGKVRTFSSLGDPRRMLHVHDVAVVGAGDVADEEQVADGQ
jgi:hypothetical protein